MNWLSPTCVLALYDVGQAGAFMTVEAIHRGIAVHQIAGFDREQTAKELSLPANLTQVVMLVLGKQAPAEALTSPVLLERERSPRVRRPLNELVIL